MYFVAIPKTGSTSVRSQTKQKGIPLVIRLDL